MNNNYVLLVILFVVCLAIRSGYELLKDAGKINPENNLIFACIFITMGTLWVSWFLLCFFDPYKVNLQDLIRWSGFLLFVVGIIIAIGALLQLRGLENIDHLVTTGLFSRLRHPMYTGFVLWILGWSTYHGAIASLAVGMVGIANILYWKRLEEARLLDNYGDKYRQYQQATWF
jgi:protein-S-isoprenylcysteine O-methyltransferase Ste14